MFCNVERKNVVAFRDVAHTIYECPLGLRRDKVAARDRDMPPYQSCDRSRQITRCSSRRRSMLIPAA
jgi:CTP synthase